MKIGKQALLEQCLQLIDHKLGAIQNAIKSYQKDLDTETKSSAGDKHETGRAMLQLEMEKLGQQYQIILSQKNVLDQIDITTKKKAQIGSLVLVNKDLYYFLATSVGLVLFDDIRIMVVSVHAPIGRILLGKMVKDNFQFNGRTLEITNIT